MIATNPEMGRPRFMSNPNRVVEPKSFLAKKPEVSQTPTVTQQDKSESASKDFFIRDPNTDKLMVNVERLNELQARLLLWIGLGGTVGAVSVVALEAIARLPH